ncbi:hypothetical protein [Diaphorobacter sp. ED-3]|uniref:hypothetical protein n=1 Tax=Diaphorobacter sp. ED-3 TaxID=3016636 RepID=UPI0022DD6483|nr:hypothetical protein [Diaphorobacter sp. ED-3]
MYGFNPEKMKKQAKAEGPGLGFKPRSAAQAQALNQAPDTIPGMFKPGEFVLPPDTVHAMGGPEALQGVVDATHTPAPDTAAVPRGFQPQVFFAQGGSVDDEVSRQKANSFGDASAAAADPAVRQVQPAPNSPSNTFPGNRTQGASGFSGAPVGQADAPATAPAAARGMPTRNPGPSELFMNDRTQELRQQVGAGNYAQAAGTAARTAVQGLGMYGLEAADKVATPVIDAARGFGRGLFGSDANAAPAPAASTPAATPAAKPATAATNPTDTRLAVGTQTAPASTPNPAPAPTPDASAGKQVMPGVYSHGPGQYSDSAQGMGFKPGFTGQPSAQNLAAADNLARGFNSSARPADPGPALGFGPGSEMARVQAPTVLHSGNSWQARNDLRNLQVGASSITNSPTWSRGAVSNDRGRQISGTADQYGNVAAYQAALGADTAARGAQPAFDMAAARENAAIQREGMQQQGATTRSAISAGIDQQRVGIEGQKAAGQIEAQGIANRQAQQQEQLLAVLADPQASVSRKLEAQRTLRAMAGKTEENRFTVVPGGQEWDAQAGAMRNVPARVLNNQSGQFVEQPGQGGQAQAPQDAAQRQVGMTYLLPNGKTGRWTEKGWLLVS